MVGLREGGEKHSWGIMFGGLWHNWKWREIRPPPIPLSMPQMGTLDPGHMPPLC